MEWHSVRSIKEGSMLALAFWYILLVIETIMAITLFAVLTPFLLGFLVLGFYLVITKNNKVSDWLVCLVVASMLAFLIAPC